jgi:hypothetical protein
MAGADSSLAEWRIRTGVCSSNTNDMSSNIRIDPSNEYRSKNRNEFYVL